ncbi:MAG: DHHA1 domain protein [Candidatus Methanofastidiosum methylothiophilum]|uniref:DHHA1 domain protein n=1 Tax=Candidatus Methanofastidiosum methylothiophilum TaxID=1705564 RepID=A0A150IVW5_9EURY|nr:MAG: DHHA1 domain protein [Candidatus Methanofastidiosum methylthiophilus]
MDMDSGFSELLKNAKEKILESRDSKIKIISHIDADGISSVAVLSLALDRLSINHDVHFTSLDGIPSSQLGDLTIFLDMGSGQIDYLMDEHENNDIIILDHHQGEYPKTPFIEVNPNIFGYSGSEEVSGSGLAYLLSLELDRKNKDLSSIAIIGAVGDMQSSWGGLKGLNRDILLDSIESGLVKAEEDLLLYGRSTRPIYKSLQYFSDPPIPGVTGSDSNAMELLNSLGIPCYEGDWRTVSDMTCDEKRKLATEIIRKTIMSVPQEYVSFIPQMIMGESYSLVQEEERSPLKDASEFATCLNACGKNGRPEVGYYVCKGNRGVYYDILLGLLRKHRKNIARSMSLVESRGVVMKEKFQYFDGSGINDTIVGTVASLVLGNRDTDPFLPIVAFTTLPNDPNVYKISARCSRLLVLKGLNLGKEIKKSAELVGGKGGGHPPACGAYVPIERLTEFLHIFEENIATSI